MRNLMGWLAAPAACVLVLASACSGDDEQSTEKISTALQDRLADALQFDGGLVVDGQHPKGVAGDAAPQVSNFEAPPSLTLGQPFTVKLHTGFADITKIAKAVVFVEGASKHVLVTNAVLAADGGGAMTLTGALEADEQLRGRDFTVKLALQTGDGVTGEYTRWALAIADEEPAVAIGDETLQAAISGPAFFPGRPKISGLRDVPQVTSVDVPDVVGNGNEFDVTLWTNNAGADKEVTAVAMTYPGFDGHYRFEDFTLRAAQALTNARLRQEAANGESAPAGAVWGFTVHFTIDDENLIGQTVQFQFALMNKDGVIGAWVEVEIEIVRAEPEPEPADDDEICEPDCADKACGGDGCGGSCGDCPPGEFCDAAAGACETPPPECPEIADCTNLACGPDPVCGASCGECAPDNHCDAGLCVPDCVPQCAGRQCGDDGCGNECGSCATGETCALEGLCEFGCTPDCTGRVCGPDPNCGESCGDCAAGEACDAGGACNPVCTPQCAGLNCGDDGCGGTCGACGGDDVCIDGVCGPVVCPDMKDCAATECGPDPVCNEDCGTCASGFTCDNNVCVEVTCTPDCTNKTCGDDGCGGACGTCAAGETCGETLPGTFACVLVTGNSDCALVGGLQPGAPWGRYRGCNDGVGRTSLTAPASPTQQWIFTAAGAITSSPVIAADGTVYFGAAFGGLYGVNPDGTSKLLNEIGATESSPAIDANGTIFIGAEDGNFYAVRPNNTLLWTFPTGGAVKSPAVLAAGGVAYFGSDDGNIYAVNTLLGSLLWKAQVGNFVRAAPVLTPDDSIIFSANDGTTYAYDTAGNQLWAHAAGGSGATGAAVANGVAYVAAGATLYALEVSSGNENWNFATPEPILSSPAVGADGTIYFGSDYFKLYAVNPDGTQKWTFDAGGSIQTAPLIDAAGTIHVGAQDGKVYAVNPDGTLKWSFTAGGQISSSPALGANGVLYFGSSDKQLYAIGD